MSTQASMVTTKIQLSDQQRTELAKNLGIDVKFVPSELGILGVARDSASMLGVPKSPTTSFSPALIMM
jgi:hypothetical protein